MLSAKAWVENWKRLGPKLERMELEEHLKSDLGDTLLSLSDVNEASVLAYPPEADSGLIEMQRVLARSRK